ncbi:MAG: ABC transporter permease [Bacteroidetes bacterium]|nr:ABC transporter permease [Bacteroidota bacterium]MCL5738953.1 ABC transporter permease [Bacteroidota bacterium]
MFENILTIYQKEYRQLKRDKLSLTAIILVPTMMLLLYGYALNFDVKHVKLGVLDESNTKQSRELTQKFFSTEYFDFAGVVPKESAINKFIQDGKGAAVLVIPRNYVKKILLDKSENVQVLLDGSNSNTATIIMGYVDGILQNYSADLTVKYMNQKGFPILGGAIDFRPRVYYNPGLKSMMYLVPGLVAFILMILTTIVPTISIVREKERGTIEHIMLAPVNPFQVIIGKALLYFILSLGATVMVLVTSVVLFNVPVRGNILLLAFTIILFLIAGLGIGILISTLVSTQQQGYLFASTLSNLPNMILSGFIYPISSMPIWLQGLTYFFPGRFFIAALRGILLKGAGFTDIYDQILPLLFFAIAIPALASWRLSRKGI